MKTNLFMVLLLTLFLVSCSGPDPEPELAITITATDDDAYRDYSMMPGIGGIGVEVKVTTCDPAIEDCPIVTAPNSGYIADTYEGLIRDTDGWMIRYAVNVDGIMHYTKIKLWIREDK